MSEQVLMGIINLMLGILSTEATTEEAKNRAHRIIDKCTEMMEKHISTVYNREVTNLVV